MSGAEIRQGLGPWNEVPLCVRSHLAVVMELLEKHTDTLELHERTMTGLDESIAQCVTRSEIKRLGQESGTDSDSSSAPRRGRPSPSSVTLQSESELAHLRQTIKGLRERVCELERAQQRRDLDESDQRAKIELVDESDLMSRVEVLRLLSEKATKQSVADALKRKVNAREFTDCIATKLDATDVEALIEQRLADLTVTQRRAQEDVERVMARIDELERLRPSRDEVESALDGVEQQCAHHAASLVETCLDEHVHALREDLYAAVDDAVAAHDPARLAASVTELGTTVSTLAGRVEETHRLASAVRDATQCRMSEEDGASEERVSPSVRHALERRMDSVQRDTTRALDELQRRVDNGTHERHCEVQRALNDALDETRRRTALIEERVRAHEVDMMRREKALASQIHEHESNIVAQTRTATASVVDEAVRAARKKDKGARNELQMSVRRLHSALEQQTAINRSLHTSVERASRTMALGRWHFELASTPVSLHTAVAVPLTTTILTEGPVHLLEWHSGDSAVVVTHAGLYRVRLVVSHLAAALPSPSPPPVVSVLANCSPVMHLHTSPSSSTRPPTTPFPSVSASSHALLSAVACVRLARRDRLSIAAVHLTAVAGLLEISQMS